MNDTPRTRIAVSKCFQTGPTSEYKVYASSCEKIEHELNDANDYIYQLTQQIRIKDATIASLNNALKNLTK